MSECVCVLLPFYALHSTVHIAQTPHPTQALSPRRAAAAPSLLINVQPQLHFAHLLNATTTVATMTP